MSTPRQACWVLQDRIRNQAFDLRERGARRQAARLSDDVSRLTALQEQLITIMETMMGTMHLMSEELKAHLDAADRKDISGRPELTVIVNDAEPQPSRRGKPRLRLAGDSQ